MQSQNIPHAHHHSHHHSHGHDHAGLAEANAAHFDAHIAGRDSMEGAFAAMYTAMEQELLNRRSWYGLRAAVKNNSSGSPVRMLDYACGGGHATKTMLPWVDEVVGLDVSGRSIEAYNAWGRENGMSETQMKGFVGNLMVDGECKAKEMSEFDLIIMNMALHHVHDPGMLISRLVQRLKKGSGYLVFIDWDEKGCTLPMVDAHKHKHGAVKSGFEDRELRAYLDQAGCDDADVQLITSYTEAGQAFVAKGKRKA